MKHLLHSMLASIGFFLISAIGYSQTLFIATLSGAQENPAVVTTANGTGIFRLTEEGLEFRITVDGLTPTAAHFHLGATGANGGVVRNIITDFDGNTASGIWTSSDAQPLTEDLVKELLLGHLYVNAHTADNTGGEIRGQVTLSAGTGFTANLTGAQENPSVTTGAHGTGVFTLTDAGLIFSVTVEGLKPTAAHFHLGATGANGGVVRNIITDFVGNTAFGIWTATDAQPLTDDLVKELLLGHLYVNAHTPTNPGGEIRGQVNLSSGIGFTANLDGSQESPVVETSARGTASFTLTNAGLVFSVTVEGLKISNAHFHLGAPGVSGGVVRAILADFVGNTATGVWRPSDAQSLSEDMVAELLRGNIYLNVHSADHPGGEIRGQVLRNSGVGFTANLTGDQENPAVASAATGTGSFVLTDTGLVFSVTIDSMLAITNAHFHLGATGANGGVVRAILADFAGGNTARGVWKSTDAQPLTDDLIKSLLAGNLYVNAHTALNGGGEIRGQVRLSSGTGFSARLTGDQENPAIVSAAMGTGSFTLTDAGLVFSVTIDSSLMISNAHFHLGATGANGGVVRAILADFVGNTATGIWRSTDAQPLTDELVQALLAGKLYVNAHSATNPGGEIRGQVLLSEGRGFSASLMGEQEVPAVTTLASGTGGFTLTESGLVFNTTVTGLEVTNAHFHNAPAGESGGVVRAILADFDGNTASGIWRSSDAQPLTNDLMAELVLGNLYVNAHTAANPGGEIRGQLGPFDFFTNVEYVDDSRAGFRENSLAQNAPNPFTGSTEIRFNLPRAGQTMLKVYDLTGREIAVLVNENLAAAGTYKVTFEPYGLPAGMYVYRLQANGVNETRMMVVR